MKFLFVMDCQLEIKETNFAKKVTYRASESIDAYFWVFSSKV